MNKVVSVLIAAIFLSLCFIPERGAAHSSGVTQGPDTKKRAPQPVYVEGDVLVKLKPGVSSLASPDRLMRQIMPRVDTTVEPLNTINVGDLYLMHIGAGTPVEGAIAQLNADPRVEYAEPNYLWRPTYTFPDDPDFLQSPLGPMWGLLDVGTGSSGDVTGVAGIEAPRAWDITTGSGKVVVGVTDTGIDITHQDLQANIWVNPNPGAVKGFKDDINGWNFADNNNQVFEEADGSHGTHVTGTIGAVGDNGIGVTGVLWHVQLMALKFISSTGNGTTGAAVRAIDYAISQKKLGANIRVINASWGGGGNSQGLRDAIVAAGKAGILFVCAAGNGLDDSDQGPGVDMDVAGQAAFPGAWNNIKTLISVAAIDQTDTIAGFSNFGHSTVTVGAPGVGIWSTFPNNVYAPLDGTSMASPHVAGVAALLADNEPNLTPAQIKQRIIATAQPVLSLASMTATSGRVDAYDALTNQVAPPGPPAVSAVSTTKKVVTVDGLGFLSGSAVVQVNGVSLPKTIYDPTYEIANGTLTRLSVKLGKAGMASAFPIGVTVSVTVFNPTTGQTSTKIPFTNQ
jgi:subtilisin family serine protease